MTGNNEFDIKYFKEHVGERENDRLYFRNKEGLS